MKILAIETSCDETSVAVVEDGVKLHSLVINSQIDIHKAFGGVVPEIAARSHIEVILMVVQQALEEAFSNISPQTNDNNFDLDQKQRTPNHELWDQIDAIAVTQGPGLSGSLLIGVLTARSLAWILNKPLYPVHHILGHVYANWLTEKAQPAKVELSKEDSTKSESSNLTTKQSRINELQLPSKVPEFPVLALIVSGGHTQLMLGTDHDNWRVIGRTQDDAVGEAFDKVAKVLGLPYPGGPSVASIAKNGDSKRYVLPIPKVESIDDGLLDLRLQLQHLDIGTSASHSLNFSFSGLKTAVLRAVQKECGVAHDFPSFELSARLSDTQKADFAASFQAKAIEYLVSKTIQAYEEFVPKTVIIGGGVAASLPLRLALYKQLPLEIEYAPQILCTDNAAMIGARAYFQSLSNTPIDPRKLSIKPSWPL